MLLLGRILPACAHTHTHHGPKQYNQYVKVVYMTCLKGQKVLYAKIRRAKNIKLYTEK